MGWVRGCGWELDVLLVVIPGIRVVATRCPQSDLQTARLSAAESASHL